MDGRKIFLILLLTASVMSIPSGPNPQKNQKWLLTMKDGTDKILSRFSSSTKIQNRVDRIQNLVGLLKDHTKASQKNVIDFLTQEMKKQEEKLSFKVLWISNQIILTGADDQLIQKLLERSDVGKIVEDFKFQLDHHFETGEDVKLSRAAADITSWGIDKILAPQVWAKGFNGSGIIVATIDSGAQGDHQALVNNFVGAENLGWYDPIENQIDPFDDLGHGTHTMGTIVGHFRDASGETKISVAPGARWMACKGCNGDNYCWASDVESCFQYLLCPGDQNGDCDPSKAPHVINNSYFIDYVRGTRDDAVEAALDALHAANICMVFSIGNAAYCKTAGYPGDYKSVIGVGSTTSSDDLSSFSSSGPGNTHGLDEIKPEVVAPGSNIMSSVVGNGRQYGSKSGTSMAGPHVAGVVALMLSKNKNLDVTQVRQILLKSVETMEMSAARNCGGIPDTQFPNFSLGYGRINALTAVDNVPAPR